MAASVDVQEANGAGPTWNIVTSARFATMDSYNPGTSNPIPIPTSGTNRSFWKHHALWFSGSFSQITNVRIYSDGAMWSSGQQSYIAVETLTEAQYAQASGTVGTTGANMVAGNPNVGSKQLFNIFTSGSPKVVDSGPITSGRCKAVVLQLDIDNLASAGTLAAETVTWRYDET
jgi:hypothetical protein